MTWVFDAAFRCYGRALALSVQVEVSSRRAATRGPTARTSLPNDGASLAMMLHTVSYSHDISDLEYVRSSHEAVPS